MALFGKKKTAEQTAPQINPEDDIQFADGDAGKVGLDRTGLDETGANDGPAIDFDAIAQDLNTQEDGADMDSFLGKTNAQNVGAQNIESDDFATSSHNDGLDFDSTFDDGSIAPIAGATVIQTDEDPFGNSPVVEPVYEEPALTTNAPPLTYTAPLLTSDVAAGGSSPAVRNSLPLKPLLGAAGLLVALGVVGYVVFGRTPAPDETAAPVVASSALPKPSGEVLPVTSTGSMPIPGTSANAVNPGIAVDGVPIAPGPVVALAPPGAIAPALQIQLKALWNKGAAAKRAKNFAGARAAWTEILRLSPNHPGIQSAIDQLPAA